MNNANGQGELRVAYTVGGAGRWNAAQANGYLQGHSPADLQAQGRWMGEGGCWPAKPSSYTVQDRPATELHVVFRFLFLFRDDWTACSRQGPWSTAARDPRVPPVWRRGSDRCPRTNNERTKERRTGGWSRSLTTAPDTAPQPRLVYVGANRFAQAPPRGICWYITSPVGMRRSGPAAEALSPNEAAVLAGCSPRPRELGPAHQIGPELPWRPRRWDALGSGAAAAKWSLGSRPPPMDGTSGRELTVTS